MTGEASFGQSIVKLRRRIRSRARSVTSCALVSSACRMVGKNRRLLRYLGKSLLLELEVS